MYIVYSAGNMGLFNKRRSVLFLRMGVNVVVAAAAVVCRSEVCPLPSEDWSEFIELLKSRTLYSCIVPLLICFPINTSMTIYYNSESREYRELRN